MSPQDNSVDGDFVIYRTGGPKLKGLEYVGRNFAHKNACMHAFLAKIGPFTTFFHPPPPDISRILKNYTLSPPIHHFYDVPRTVES